MAAKEAPQAVDELTQAEVWADYRAALQLPDPYDGSYLTLLELMDHFGLTYQATLRRAEMAVKLGEMEKQRQLRQTRGDRRAVMNVYRVIKPEKG